MNHLIKLIKGSFVGMGSILPGISGSMIAAILKIYQDLITALNQVTHHPIKAILSIWQYLIGILIGLGMGFVFIRLFLDRFPLPLTILFIGFILGAIPGILKEFKQTKSAWHHFMVMALMMGLMIGFMFIQEGSNASDGWTYYLVVFLIGLITSAALITPGLSGATLLLALGYFNILIDLGDDVIRALLTFNFTEIAGYLPMLLMLLLGLLVGLIVMGKIMYHVLMSYRVHFFYGVLGIVIISPINILLTLQDSVTGNVFDAPWYMYLISLVCFFIGLYLTQWITKKGQKTEDLT